jgi:hypothetical protein
MAATAAAARITPADETHHYRNDSRFPMTDTTGISTAT